MKIRNDLLLEDATTKSKTQQNHNRQGINGTKSSDSTRVQKLWLHANECAPKMKNAQNQLCTGAPKPII